jgi:hypothetical protein
MDPEWVRSIIEDGVVDVVFEKPGQLIVAESFRKNGFPVLVINEVCPPVFIGTQLCGSGLDGSNRINLSLRKVGFQFAYSPM